MQKKINFISSFIIFFLTTEIMGFVLLFFVFYQFMGLSLDKVVSDMGSSMVVAIICFSLVAIYIYKILKPIKEIENKRINNQEITDNDKQKIFKIEKFLKIFFLLANIIGFFVAPVIAILATVLVNGFLRWSTVRILIICLFMGPVIGITQYLFFSFLVQKIKVVLGLYEFAITKKTFNFKKKLFFTIIMFSLLINVILILFSITREERIAGISNCVFMKNNIEEEKANGYFTRLLQLSINSNDLQIKEEAKNILKNWEKDSINHNYSIVFFGVLLFLLFMGLIYLFVSNISSHLYTIINGLKSISKIDGDLTNFIVKTSEDEIGEIQVLINQLILNLNKTFITIYDTANNIINETNNKQKSIDSLINSNKEIIDTSNEISNVLSNQVSVSQTTSSNVNEIVKLMDKNIEKITSQSSMVEESSSSIEEMSASIFSVSDATKKAAIIGGDLDQASKEGQEVISQMQESIDDISKVGTGISEIVNKISSITERTNLLALNAAIEAAHAGEAGKGFAVVADEIRKLAENSSSQTGEIIALLESMTNSIQNVVTRSLNMSKSTDKTQKDICSMVQIVQEINNATKEQSLGVNENMNAIEQLVHITSTIMTNLEEQKVKNRELLSSTGEMEVSAKKNIEVGVKQKDYFEGLKDKFDDFYHFFHFIQQQLDILGEKMNALKLVDKKLLTVVEIDKK